MKKILLSCLSLALCATVARAAEEFSTNVNLAVLRTEAASLATPPAATPVAESAFYPNVEINRGHVYASLPNCGGYVELKVTHGQVNLIFRDVVNCSNFDILSNKGGAIDYPNRKLGGADRARAGSFTLPRNVIEWGNNGVVVAIQSNSKKTRDLVLVRFWAF